MAKQEEEFVAPREGVLKLVREGGGQSPIFGRTPADPTPLPLPESEGAFDLEAPECYLNRELTWLNFNYRVLHEAQDLRTPLLERVKFLSIVGSNLDEFFMKRIGGLKQQLGARVSHTTVDGRTPRRQIKESYDIASPNVTSLTFPPRRAYVAFKVELILSGRPWPLLHPRVFFKELITERVYCP